MSSPSGPRALLIEQAAAYLQGLEPERANVARQGLTDELAAFSDEQVLGLFQRVATTGETWGYHPKDDVARVVAHYLAQQATGPDSQLFSGEHLAAAQGRPITFLANHLSFSDAHMLEFLLVSSGHEAIASRLVVLAGPKVYTDPLRKLSSLTFGSIKTPQSTDRASGEAVMPRREVARLAAETIAAVETRRAAGDHVLIFVEGTRSRAAAMQAALPAVSRYLDQPGTLVVPVGIAGSQHLVPIGDDKHAHRANVHVRIGRPVEASAIGQACGAKRKLMMDVVGLLIARELPASYRGAYGDDATELADARAVVARLDGG